MTDQPIVATEPTASTTPITDVAIVGAGRVGTALVRALGLAKGPFGRGFDGAGFEVVVLAVPDSQIADAAGAIRPGPLVGHCSGLTDLDVLHPHEAFGLHPLMTVTSDPTTFTGAAAAIEGTTPRALATARALAVRLGLRPFEIRSVDRPAYHAAASIAANYVVTLEDAAEALLATIGQRRDILVPLVRAAIENWAAQGGPAALTGPIARGDESTVARQRAAVAQRCPEHLAMFDELTERTRAMAARR